MCTLAARAETPTPVALMRLLVMWISQPSSALTASPSNSRLRLSICRSRAPWHTIGSCRTSTAALVTPARAARAAAGARRAAPRRLDANSRARPREHSVRERRLDAVPGWSREASAPLGARRRIAGGAGCAHVRRTQAARLRPARRYAAGTSRVSALGRALRPRPQSLAGAAAVGGSRARRSPGRRAPCAAPRVPQAHGETAALRVRGDDLDLVVALECRARPAHFVLSPWAQAGAQHGSASDARHAAGKQCCDGYSSSHGGLARARGWANAMEVADGEKNRPR